MAACSPLGCLNTKASPACWGEQFVLCKCSEPEHCDIPLVLLKLRLCGKRHPFHLRKVVMISHYWQTGAPATWIVAQVGQYRSSYCSVCRQMVEKTTILLHPQCGQNGKKTDWSQWSHNPTNSDHKWGLLSYPGHNMLSPCIAFWNETPLRIISRRTNSTKLWVKRDFSRFSECPLRMLMH